MNIFIGPPETPKSWIHPCRLASNSGFAAKFSGVTDGAVDIEVEFCSGVLRLVEAVSSSCVAEEYWLFGSHRSRPEIAIKLEGA